MKRELGARVRVFIAAVLCIATACSEEPEGAPTAEQARFALVGWLMNHSEAWVRKHAARVEQAAPLARSSTQVAFGPWTCDLSSRRFSAVFPVQKGGQISIEGDFVLAPNGLWIARGKSHHAAAK